MGRALVGIDPSSAKIAIMISVNEGKPYKMVKALAKGGDIAAVCLAAFRYVRAAVRDLKADGHRVYLYLEEPVVGRGGAYTTIRQSKVNGAILAAALSGGAEVHGVNNTTWKKSVVGNGNAGKPMIKEWVRLNWEYAYDLAKGDQDVLDAACILRYAQQCMEVLDRLEDHRSKEIIEMETTRRRPVRRVN